MMLVLLVKLPTHYEVRGLDHDGHSWTFSIHESRRTALIDASAMRRAFAAIAAIAARR